MVDGSGRHQREHQARRARLHRRMAFERPQGADAAQDVVEREAIRKTIARLPPAQRQAVVAVVLDGLAAYDAATVLGCTPSAMTTRLSRARRQLARGWQALPCDAVDEPHDNSR